jgi:hypothetical protein
VGTTIYGQSLLENESDEVSAFSKWFWVKLRGQVRHADSAMMISSMIRKREKRTQTIDCYQRWSTIINSFFLLLWKK